MRSLLLLALLAAGCTATPPASDAGADLPDGVTLVAAVTVTRTAPHTDLVASPSPPDALVHAWATVEAVYRGEADGEVSFLIEGPALKPGERLVVFLRPTEARVPWRSAAPPASYSSVLDAVLR